MIEKVVAFPLKLGKANEIPTFIREAMDTCDARNVPFVLIVMDCNPRYQYDCYSHVKDTNIKAALEFVATMHECAANDVLVIDTGCKIKAEGYTTVNATQYAITVRRLTDSDIEQVKHLLPDSETVVDCVCTTRNIVYGAFCGNNLHSIAVSCIVDLPTSLSRRNKKIAYVTDVFTERGYRGIGMASKVIKKLMDILRELYNVQEIRVDSPVDSFFVCNGFIVLEETAMLKEF